MASVIKKIKLINFRRFRNYTIEPNEQINILVGDNEAGKSSVLEAVDLVANGSIRRVESIGLDRLLNIDAVEEFNAGERTFERLPELRIELYLSGELDFSVNGRNNTDGTICDGIRLVCAPNLEYSAEIIEAINDNVHYFPYDYYSIRFSTFADEAYTGYKKKLRSVFIDSTNMSTEYATNDFVRRMYMQYTNDDAKERAKHKSAYRLLRTRFQSENLTELNHRLPAENNYAFGLKCGSSVDLEDDLMIYENNIGIDNKGTGRQVFVKTEFALGHADNNADIILIEEPENHLSPVNLRRLVQQVAEPHEGQLFITTHNSLISARLELRNLIIMNNGSGDKPITLKNLSIETAKYFMKTPPAGIIEFALSGKSLLVEGPSEYMLLEKFYWTIADKSPESDGVNIIDVRGLSFKRYLEIANLMNSKVAVITDNDEDFQKNCVDKYAGFLDEGNLKVFYVNDNTKYTFEVALYTDNSDLCTELFGENAQEYMLKNKTEAALKLLSQEQPIVVPDYIVRAINWIRL